MVLGGLWHGASWTFVIWGALHGAGQVVGHLRRTRRSAKGLSPVPEGPGRVWWARFCTFQFVCLGWVFFNASSLSNAFAVLERVLTGWGPSPLITPLLVVTVAGIIGAQYVPQDGVARLVAFFSDRRVAVQVVALALVLLAITTMGPTGIAPFIYYRF
jgi:hypothetical protein